MKRHAQKIQRIFFLMNGVHRNVKVLVTNQPRLLPCWINFELFCCCNFTVFQTFSMTWMLSNYKYLFNDWCLCFVFHFVFYLLITCGYCLNLCRFDRPLPLLPFCKCFEETVVSIRHLVVPLSPSAFAVAHRFSSSGILHWGLRASSCHETTWITVVAPRVMWFLITVASIWLPAWLFPCTLSFPGMKT